MNKWKFTLPLFLFFTYGVRGQNAGPVIIRQELIFPLQQRHVHSSSILELPDGDLLAVWFSLKGQSERTATDAKLMGSRFEKTTGKWSTPFFMAETPGLPDGNPVLFINRAGKLFLVWHVLLADVWHAAILKVRTSVDYQGSGSPVWQWQDNIFLKPGESFEREIARKMNEGDIPVPSSEVSQKTAAKAHDEKILDLSKDHVSRSIGWMSRIKPLIISHPPHEGRMLLPLYSDLFDLSLMAVSDDDGETWKAGLPLVGRGNIQPALAERKNGTIVAFMRDKENISYSVQMSLSEDGGITWSPAHHIGIRNPNSSLDVEVLQDGRWAMVCNDLKKENAMGGCCDGRQRLSLYLSEDEGDTWERVLILEDDLERAPEKEKRGRYHYPAMIRTADGLLHITYTYNTTYSPYLGSDDNSIKHVVIDPGR